MTFADGSAADFDAVVWATGFTADHSWIDVSEAKDQRGHMRHTRGVTSVAWPLHARPHLAAHPGLRTARVGRERRRLPRQPDRGCEPVKNPTADRPFRGAEVNDVRKGPPPGLPRTAHERSSTAPSGKARSSAGRGIISASLAAATWPWAQPGRERSRDDHGWPCLPSRRAAPPWPRRARRGTVRGLPGRRRGRRGGRVQQGDLPAPAPGRSGRGGQRRRQLPAGRIVVAVVLGPGGSVGTDALGPYEVFARSPAFFVYTVSPGRAASVLSGGLALVPEHSLEDVDAGLVPEPDVVVVPAVVNAAGEELAPLRDWIARHAGRGAHILGVCAGSALLAAAGLLDGRRATSHWSNIASLRRKYPQVEWVRGQRYVVDGSITTTGGVTSGIFGALRLVGQLAGTAEAERVGRELAYPGWHPGAPAAMPAQQAAPGDLSYALTAAFPWFRPTVGIGLVEGVGEIDAAAAFDIYAGNSFAARAVPIAAGSHCHNPPRAAAPRTTGRARTPHRQARRARAPAHVSELDPGFARWAADHGLDIELPHAGQADGEFSFDPLLRDLAAHADKATARSTAKNTEYPTAHLQLAGSPWPWRPTALAALTIAAAIGAAIPPRSRQAAPAMTPIPAPTPTPRCRPVDTRTGSVGIGIRRHPGRVAARPPVARPGNRPGSPASPDRSGLHRVRSGRRKTQGNRRRERRRRRVRLAGRGGRHRIGLAPGPGLRRPRSQGLLAGAQPLRCRHTVVAAVLRRRRLARRRGSHHRDHCRSRISSLARRQAGGRAA